MRARGGVAGTASGGYGPFMRSVRRPPTARAVAATRPAPVLPLLAALWAAFVLAMVAGRLASP